MPNIDAISPLDGRYREKLSQISETMSEAGLLRQRTRVECAWLLALTDSDGPFEALPEKVNQSLRGLWENPDQIDVGRIKEIESETNHDVKAVEYYLREVISAVGGRPQDRALIHFGCTSEDINNTAYGLMIKQARAEAVLPRMDKIVAVLQGWASEFADAPMMSRTHGQTASPSTLGKEMAVFAYRLARQCRQFESVPILAKMNGAVGNYHAHDVALPSVDWQSFSRDFIEKRLGLEFNPLTTQIESHDALVEICDALRRFNTVMIDYCRDMWGYISLGFFRQELKGKEVGSSTMPHKVNPIDFENAEGNLGIANSLAGHFAEKLPISRWQRDLSDSTVQRSLGSLFGYSVLAYESSLRGMAKVKVDRQQMLAELDGSWEVLAEAVQSVMRVHGVEDAYERLKAATRGQAVTKEALQALVNDCSELPDADRQRLLALAPAQYLGLARDLATQTLGESV